MQLVCWIFEMFIVFARFAACLLAVRRAASSLPRRLATTTQRCKNYCHIRIKLAECRRVGGVLVRQLRHPPMLGLRRLLRPRRNDRLFRRGQKDLLVLKQTTNLSSI